MRFNQLGRREFISLLGGAAVEWSLIARAQHGGKLYRIGILSPELPPPGLLDAFRQGLRELGYVEGQDFTFEAEMQKDTANGSRRLLIIWWNSKLM